MVVLNCGMRYVAWITLGLLMSGLPAWAQIGPPQPRAQCHGYSLGVGMHNAHSVWMPYDYEVARNRVYLEGSYAFNESMEIFGRAGGSDWVVNDIETYRPGISHDVSSDGYPAFLSGGLRGKAWQWGPVTVGASLEAAWFPGLRKAIRWDHDVYQELYFDSTIEINTGLSLGYPLGRSVVYCGPSLHFAYTRVDVRTHEFGPDWEIEDSIDALTIRDKAGWGGFLGWYTPLGENGWHLQLEGAGMSGGFQGAIGFFRSW